MRIFVSLLLLAIHSLAFGKEVTRKMEFQYLTSFEYIGPAWIEIKQGKENLFSFSGEEDVVNHFEISFSGGALKIAPKDLADLSQFTSIPHGVLIVSNLRNLVLNGDSLVSIDSLKADNLAIELRSSGSASLEGNIQCNRMILSITGSSQAIITGTCRYQTVYINGSGLYDGRGFITRNTNIRLIGPSSALINAQEGLAISILGFGHVRYVGSPKVEKHVEGKGVVSPLTPDIIKQFEEKRNEQS